MNHTTAPDRIAKTTTDPRAGDTGLPFGIPLPELLSRSKTVVTRSSASGLWRYETCVDADAVRAIASYWDPAFDKGKADAVLVEPSGLIAEVVTWSAPLHVDSYDPETIESLDEVWACCEAESADLAVLLSRLRAQIVDGTLDAMFEAWGFVSRLLLLDSVTVAPAWRGHGVGVHLAARSLLTAGAFDTCAMIAAVAGSRGMAGHGSSMERSRNLLGSLGLTEADDDVWVGSCAMRRPGDTIVWLAEV